MFCSKCGSRLSGGGSFCQQCGSRIVGVRSPAAPAVSIATNSEAYNETCAEINELHANYDTDSLPDDLKEIARLYGEKAPEIADTAHAAEVQAVESVHASEEVATVEEPDLADGIRPEAASLFPENEPVIEPQSFPSAMPQVPQTPQTPHLSHLSHLWQVPQPPQPTHTPHTPHLDPHADYDNEPFRPAIPAPPADPFEKQYFGKPALVFCLVIIGLLSACCGTLAALYFGAL
ncbi:MAG: hypothetical protein FWH20_09185 [Oscillospiraceae bacterium]|nr:hypothetical protein [Oscillospiraceae bacterium]